MKGKGVGDVIRSTSNPEIRWIMVYFEQKRLLKIWWERPALFIVLYGLCLSLTIWIDVFLYPERDMFIWYMVDTVFAGFVFWRNTILQVLAAAVITWLDYALAPFPFPHVNVFLSQALIHLLAILSISFAIKYYNREKENTLNLTLTLAKSLDSRDPYTAYHSDNVAYYAVCIAMEMKLKRKQCGHIYIGGLLHDIGKIGVPEAILNKPSKLTKEEYEVIKQHPVIGYEMVKHISFFEKNGVLDMILFHHERYDGTGYPHGLQGTDIPLAARIMAVADSFDVMTSRRVYRHEADIRYALDEIRKHKGTQFDPDIADVFIQIVEREGERILSHPRNILTKSM
ncbi:HD-GYP domain-containing protein [Paenibacillus thiaminolyticus]|uniref:HD-GYP domain-containing protein n=1 Tax=Paenibacillus thiaminolyticus TaxID=49283 RepID=UPI0035A57F87